jgi:hypothetical protein
LNGGAPLLIDSQVGQTRATHQLTWYSNDDRLISDGVNVKSPVKSIIRKKK